MGLDLTWLDLCCGRKGASQPAIDRGSKVITVDIDPRFKPDIVADVRSLPLKPFHVDVLWTSTPCTEYSKWGLRCFYPNPERPCISRELGVLRAIERLQPKVWVVENVWAARPWFGNLFGPVRNRVPGHCLWSNTQFLLPSLPAHKGSFHYKHSSGKRWGAVSHNRKEWFDRHGLSFVGTGHNGVEAAEAAKIPYEIGEAICIAVERRMGKRG